MKASVHCSKACTLSKAIDLNQQSDIYRLVNQRSWLRIHLFLFTIRHQLVNLRASSKIMNFSVIEFAIVIQLVLDHIGWNSGDSMHNLSLFYYSNIDIAVPFQVDIISHKIPSAIIRKIESSQGQGYC